MPSESGPGRPLQPAVSAAGHGGPEERPEAIVLVGGQGTRLRPLTVGTPKPLLPTAGVPFLAHQLARLAAAGIGRVILATAYRAEMFAEVLGDGSAYGIDLHYISEPAPLGTGGGIRNAAASLRGGPDNPVLVLNGDVLSGHDLGAQLALHEKAEAAVTLHLVQVPDPARFGCVPTSSDGRVTAFLEKTPQPVASQVNAGCYVFRRRVIDQMPAGLVLSVERDTFPALIAAGEVVLGYLEAAYWLDVGTPEAFVRGSCDLVLGRLESPLLPGPPGQSLRLADAAVDPAATLSGGTVVGAGCAVGAGALLDEAVLFDDVQVGEGAVIRTSAIGAGARIGAGAVLDGVVIGAGAQIAGGNELRGGMRVWPGVSLPDTAIRFSTDT